MSEKFRPENLEDAQREAQKKRELIADKIADPKNVERAIKEAAKSHMRGDTVTLPSSGTAEGWAYETKNDKFLELLKDKPLTDLGAGHLGASIIDLGLAANSNEINCVDLLGNVMGSSRFDLSKSHYEREGISCDKLNLIDESFYEVKGDFYKPTDFSRKDHKEKVLFIRDDMLHFISQLPDNYGNFTLNSIDDVIEDPDYLDFMAYHLNRCTPSGGVVFGMNTLFLRKLDIYGFKDVTQDILGPNRYSEIFQKQ